MTKLAAILFAASAASAAPVFAQDSAITLRVDSGTVMSSTGGEYASANTGKPLVVGEKIMINAGSSASAVYDGGCTVEFKEPGVYEVLHRPDQRPVHHLEGRRHQPGGDDPRHRGGGARHLGIGEQHGAHRR